MLKYVIQKSIIIWLLPGKGVGCNYLNDPRMIWSVWVMRIIVLCGIILTEILQGIADDTTHRRVRRYLVPLILLPMPEAVFVRAADIYRRLRKQGTTIRKTNDCIIAATVLEHHCRLLHNDKDFAAIARDYPLKVVKTGPL